MEDVRTDSDKLIALLQVGDRRVSDLIQLLDDPDPNVSLRAQVVIRYLGNETGMKALRAWYNNRQGEYAVAGPIPQPWYEWDCHLIKVDLLGKPPRAWFDRGVQYIYALALDDSPKAKTLLAEMISAARGLDETSFIGYAIKRVLAGEPKNLLRGEKDLAKLVLNNSFFIAPEDRKYTSARLLGFNEAKDKGFFEVYVNRGVMAEEWYHVVLTRCDQGWKFFSITPVAMS
jgi:hypothetical protein